MSQGLWAAVVSGGFGVIVALLGMFARVNKRDHNENSGKLDKLLEGQKHLVRGHDRIETKIDTHINDHARGDV
jgi:hypothetical protein